MKRRTKSAIGYKVFGGFSSSKLSFFQVGKAWVFGSGCEKSSGYEATYSKP
jgi:hypothetical protein